MKISYIFCREFRKKQFLSFGRFSLEISNICRCEFAHATEMIHLKKTKRSHHCTDHYVSWSCLIIFFFFSNGKACREFAENTWAWKILLRAIDHYALRTKVNDSGNQVDAWASGIRAWGLLVSSVEDTSPEGGLFSTFKPGLSSLRPCHVPLRFFTFLAATSDLETHKIPTPSGVRVRSSCIRTPVRKLEKKMWQWIAKTCIRTFSLHSPIWLSNVGY